ncbi:hypothetical protein PBRA_008252 [Plasmodiophora brassicae]|uniref:Uncharacterized protein n=1 Tax=Plasmodiophora brassicae TaxID=37360 RepID=A0A0G4J029_PLABS|nr:hypothetical protein PBRA_008252 [Plasmodiophora brassicae]
MRDGQTAQIHELRKARLDEASRADAIRSDLTDQIRDLDRKLSEQRLTNGQLRAELDDVRADNDKVTASRAALELQHIQDVKQLQSQIGILSAQLDMAAARTSAANDARDQALAQLRDVELDCRRLRLQVLEQERCLAEERTAHDRERVEAKARYDQDRVQLEGGRAHLERQVENHLARIAQLERSAQDAVAQHEERTRTLEASCKDEVDAAQTALQALQGRVRDLEAALAKAQDQAALSDERLQAEASLARVRAECDAATNAQRVLQAQVDERNVAVKAAQAACRQTEGDLKAANEAVARWQQKATSLEVDGARESAEWSAERTLLVGQVQDLDQRYRQAALKVKDLEAEAAQSQAALEATIRSLKKDRLKQKQTTKELRERLADVIRELAAVKQGASEGDPMPSIKELLEQQSESDAQIKDLMARIPI